jgi:hypothetical protein
MANGEVVASGGSGDELSVTVRAFTAADEHGIERLVLLNVRSIPVWSADLNGCPLSFVDFVEHLSTSDLPLTLTITTCGLDPDTPGQTTTVGPFLAPGPGGGPGAIMCSPLRVLPPTAACTSAANVANAAASDAQAACDRARRDHAERDADAAVAAAGYVAAAAFAAAAAAASGIPLVGHVVAIILIVIAAVALVVAIIYTSLAASANAHYLDELTTFNNARQRYRDAMSGVNAKCCPGQAVVQPIVDCTA